MSTHPPNLPAGLGKYAISAVAAALLACAVVSAASPDRGTLGPTTGAKVTWVGTAPGGASLSGEASCVEGETCDTFILTLSATPADWAKKVARVELRWLSPSSDYDFYVHKGSANGPIVARGERGATTGEADDIDPAVDGTGDFYIHVVYFTAFAADQYNGSVTVIAEPPHPPAAPQDTGVEPRYQNHTPTQDQVAAGLGRNSQDEPSIGVNWTSGRTMFMGLLQTLRVTFNDLICPTTPGSLWEDKSFVTTSATTFDPILYTDHEPGRTFVAQLLFPTTQSSAAFTDNDGDTWTQSLDTGLFSGVDHQTIGGGPFRAPAPPHTYPNAIYYCAQDIAFATCALSVDGGLTFGAAVPIYDIRECAGLHGHVKVGPDGTAYVPNSNCNGQVNPTEQAVAVSEDNGITWDVRTVPGSIGADGSDPSVAIGKGGRVYLGYVSGDRFPAVAVSDDRGLHWHNVYDVGASLGIKGAVFPATVAGDKSRAAMAFYGTTADGVYTDIFTFKGEWHLYVAHTYNGGDSWVTVDATPNDALQLGALHLGGGGPIHRNLLDFFGADLDRQGRMLVGYADGCLGRCAQADPSATGNSYLAYSVIARQTGGRRLFAASDPPATATIPGAPALTVTRNGSLTKLTWSQSDDGGSAVTGYKVFRRAAGGTESLLAHLAAVNEYIDQSGDPRVTYSYRVVAINAAGESCGSNEVSAPPVGSSCEFPGIRVATDRSGDQVGAPANADLDLQAISLAEPFVDGASKLVFTMKVADLSIVPPSRTWRIIWNYPVRPANISPTTTFEGRFFVGMTSSATGAVTFDYGRIINEGVLVNTVSQFRIGAADPESNFTRDGTITLVLSTDKIGNPGPGDLIGGLFARTFPASNLRTLRSEEAADTIAAAATATYALVGNAFCENPPPTVECLEDNDPRIAYSNGWHTGRDAQASDGHYRFNTGKDLTHGLTLPFTIPEGATGAIVYHYAKSNKGGLADVYVDGVFQDTVDYSLAGARTVQFGYSVRYGNLASGAHTFGLRNLRGGAYVDRFCLENAFSTALAATALGETSVVARTLGAAEEFAQTLTVPASAVALSVVAEGPLGEPVRLLLIDSTGSLVETADSFGGFATINRASPMVGVYVVKVLNLGSGSVEVATFATPLLRQ
jgi:hypothetical protein